MGEQRVLPEMIKVRQQGVQGRGIDFIDDPERGFVHPVEPVHDLLIQWRQPGAAVHDHQKNIRGGERDLRLLTNEPEHAVGGGGIEPAGIDHLKATALVRALGINPVAGDARLVVDDGVPGPENPVEQGRFPDVRSPDHRHERHTRWSQTGQKRLVIRSCWGFSFHCQGSFLFLLSLSVILAHVRIQYLFLCLYPFLSSSTSLIEDPESLPCLLHPRHHMARISLSPLCHSRHS